MALILVIDDLKSIRNLIATVLKDLGHEVKLAEDGQEGIELLEGVRAFDLVITDINMPNKNGNEVARYIRKSHISSIPVAAITAFPEEADLELFARHTLPALGKDQCCVVGGHATIQDFSLIEQLH